MDELARYNKARWDELARLNVPYARAARTLLNDLICEGFVLLGVWEASSGDLEAEPGSWEHYQAYAPPFLSLWAQYRPDVFA